MAVIIKYIVVRNGEEKMTFATKKEADAYDKMLDIADNMYDFLENSKVKINESLREDISLLLAEERDAVIPILRGVKPKKTPAAKPAAKKDAPKKEAAKKEPAKARVSSKKTKTAK